MAVQALNDHCVTADDVRRTAESVARRRMRFFAPAHVPVAHEPEKRIHELPKPKFVPLSEVKLQGAVTAQFNFCAPISREKDRRYISIREIQRAVCKACDTNLEDMLANRRTGRMVLPRHIAMALSKMLTTCSLPEIGRKFNRDHTTVLHALRKFEPVMNEIRLQIWAIPLSELIALTWDTYWRLQPQLPKRTARVKQEAC